MYILTYRPNFSRVVWPFACHVCDLTCELSRNATPKVIVGVVKLESLKIHVMWRYRDNNKFWNLNLTSGIKSSIKTWFSVLKRLLQVSQWVTFRKSPPCCGQRANNFDMAHRRKFHLQFSRLSRWQNVHHKISSSFSSARQSAVARVSCTRG